MNKYNKETFESIKKAAKDYQQEVTRAYQQYRQTMNTAKQAATAYKDEAGFLAGKKGNAAHTARNNIIAAENAFTCTVKAEITSLKDELDKHLVTVPSDRFLASLNVYATYGLTPGKAEITALMEQAGGNSLALRALDAVLKQTHSQYSVRVPGADDFERDLDALERLGEGNLMWRPHEYHSEAVDVYKGTPHMVRRADGSYYDGGYTWDNIGIISASGDFDSRIKSLDDMVERWTSAILPVIYIKDAYTGHIDEKTGENVTPEQEYVNDYHATAQAGKIVDNPDATTEHIREQAKARAAESAKSKEIIQAYTGGATA